VEAQEVQIELSQNVKELVFHLYLVKELNVEEELTKTESITYISAVDMNDEPQFLQIRQEPIVTIELSVGTPSASLPLYLNLLSFKILWRWMSKIPSAETPKVCSGVTPHVAFGKGLSKVYSLRIQSFSGGMESLKNSAYRPMSPRASFSGSALLSLRMARSRYQRSASKKCS